MVRVAGDGGTRSTGSASRPNPNKKPTAKKTPKPPVDTRRATAIAAGRRRQAASSPAPVRPSPPPPGSSGDRVSSRNPTTRTLPPPGSSGDRGGKPRARPINLPTAPPAGGSGGGGGKKSLPTGKVERNYPIHPHAAPLNVHGETQFRPGKIRRVPVPGEAHIYEFHFLYNPSTISIATGINVDATYDAADVGTNFAGAAQTITFSLLLNRIHESAAGFQPGRQDTPYVYGTVHDTEYLFRCCNGDPQKLYAGGGEGGGGVSSFSALTADIGMVYANPVEVHFGRALRFVGIIQNVGIDHKSFNRAMVPMLSEVTVTLSRVTGTGVARASNSATAVEETP